MKKRGFIPIICLSGTLSILSFSLIQNVDFEEIIGKKSPQLSGKEFQLRKPAHDAFERMKAAASMAGFDIFSVSSYRSFNDQKSIWNNKYTRFTQEGSTPTGAIERIIEYSTIPGTSRHHWGTDIDVVDGNQDVSGDRLLPGLFRPGKPYSKLKEWLNQNAGKYGFKEVYTDLPGRKGFKYEPWHFSYEPLSKEYLKQYKAVGFKKLLKGLDIQGSEHLTDSFIQRYWDENMMDINPELKP